MKTKLALIVALISLGSLSLQAQSTVNYTAAPGQRDVMDSSGSGALSDGNYVSIGYFDAGFDVASFSSDLLALANAWNEYGSTSIQTVFGQAGRFAGTDSSLDPTFDGKSLYMWIFETSDDGAPVSDYGNVTAYGLYSSTSVNWAFPTQGNLPPSNMTSVNSSEINMALYGSFDANHLYLQPVPEPQTVVLLALGSCAFFALNSRRQRAR